jgi:hypothetical protein
MFLALAELLHGPKFGVQELLQEIIFASVCGEDTVIKIELFISSQPSISQVVMCGLTGLSAV